MIYTRNNNGPKMLPFGNPKVTGRASDISLSQEVCCFPLLTYEENHSKDRG